MRFAYADPPYLGKCGKFYGHNHPDGRCWNELSTHQLLIERLVVDYPDGWALSCSEPDLRVLLPLTPPGTRTAPWCKSFCAFKKGVRPAYAWEPVLFSGGRNKNHPPPEKGGAQTTPKDFLVAPITLQRGLTGAKPEAFCRWVLDLLGYDDERDTVDDLFPGTFVMSRVAARERWRERERSTAAARRGTPEMSTTETETIPATFYHPDPEINREVIADAIDAERADLAAGYPSRRWRCICGTAHSRGHFGAIGVHRCLACGYVGTEGVMFDDEGQPR